MHISLDDTNSDGGFVTWNKQYVSGQPTDSNCETLKYDNWGLDKMTGALTTDRSDCITGTLEANGRWAVGVDFKA